MPTEWRSFLRDRVVRLLCVEDSAEDAELARQVLARTGLHVEMKRVSAFVDVRSALAQSGWDAVLCDYSLGECTAIDVLDTVRNDALDVPVILVTGVLRDRDALDCIQRGATDYVLKDNLVRLPLVLERVLREAQLRLERTAAYRALHQSEAEYRLLFESNPQPMWVFDFESLAFLAVNDEAVRHYGYTRGEFLGMTLRDIRPPEDVPQLLQSLTEKRGTEDPHFQNVFRHRLKDGTLVYAEVIANPTSFAGRSAGLAVIHDVTRRVQAEEARRKAEAELSEAFDNSPHGMYRASSKTSRFIRVNPALAHLLGYDSAKELLGRDIATDIYLDPKERQRILARAQLEPQISAPVMWKKKDGTPVSVQLVAHRMSAEAPDGGQLWEVTVEDLTEKRRLEEQLHHAVKMEAVGRLAGGVAHDFNNVLMIIRGYSEMMLPALPQGAALRRNVEKILHAADRAGTLVRQLLAFSRKQVLSPRVLDPNEVVQGIAKLLPPLLGETVDLRLEPGADLGRVRVDPGQLEQVLMNLAVNARDAMPKGGKLTIETRNAEVDELFARQHAGSEPGRYVLVSVSDNGTGMDPETAAHIFEPFFTTKPAGQGTGLGLATVYGIVQQSGGFISVYTEPGKGTTFKVYLPRVDQAAEAEAPPAAPPPEEGHERILIVEDEEDVREAMKECLESHGYQVCEARNGAEALSIVDGGYRADLVITDMIMPGMGGRELADVVQAKYPHIAVLFISGYTDTAVTHQGALPPGDHFLEKPFTWQALARKVRDALEEPVAARPPQAAAGARGR